MLKSLEQKVKANFDLFYKTFEITFGLETMTFAEHDLEQLREQFRELENSFKSVFDAGKKGDWIVAQKYLEETDFIFDETNTMIEPFANWSPSKEQLRGKGFEDWKRHFKR